MTRIPRLNEPALVLNNQWQPVSIVSVKKSIIKVINESARFIDPDTFVQHNFEDWCNLEVEDINNSILTSSGNIRLPEVIVLKRYNAIHKRQVKLTRRNLFIRDRCRCVYTGKRLRLNEATIDHVIPQSRGGRTTWDNVVIASFEANVKKANRTPEEAGLTLLKVPERPKWSPIYSKFSYASSGRKYPESWKKFVKWDPELYWDIELLEE